MAETFDMTQFRRRLAELERRSEGAAPKALVEAAEQIVGDAAERCPVDTGTLAGSGTVDDSRAGEGAVEFGMNTSYAAAVHERTDVAHAQGEAKYLHKAIAEGLPKITRILGEELKRGMGT